ncbi:MAG TPA: AAA family ATPase [Flavobacteriaceae bacterium]|nr:AAA family ATPase [Flavobacteriaceae bacterium]
MRILKVAFKNIHSLSGEHKIDFTKEPFTFSPLFVITGATGSGKSSILDAISLALYNTTPRMGRVSRTGVDTGGAILTRGQEEAYAKVTYACKQGIFRSEWHITTARTGNLRDYDMYLYDVETDKALNYNKGAIPKANEERIGLSYDQFNKSVILAQGEFAEFLKAPKKERGDLLEKITGSGIYRKIGMAVWQKFRSHGKKSEELEVVLQSKKDEQKPKEEVQAKSAEEIQLQKQLKKLVAQVDVLKEQNKQIDILLKKQAESKKTHAELTASSEALKKFMAQEGKLWQEHKKLLPYLSDIQTWEQTANHLKRLEEQKNKLVQEKQSLAATNQQLCDNIAKIVKTEVTETNAIADLDVFYGKYEQLEKQVLELRSEYREEQATANGLIRNFEPQIRFETKNETFASDVESSIEETKSKYNHLLLKVAIASKDLTEQSVEHFSNKIINLRQAQLVAQNIQNLHANEKNSRKQIETSKKKLTELDGQQKLLDTQVKLALANFEKLDLEKQNAVLTQSLEEHRNRLKEGEACPLCGSLEHPFALHTPTPPSELEEALKAAKSEYDKAIEKQLKSKSDRENIATQIANDEKAKKETLAKLEQLDKDFKKQYQQITEDPVNFDFAKNIALQEAKFKHLQNALGLKKQLQILTELLPVAKKMVALSKQGKELNTEKNMLYTGENFKEVYHKIREDFQQNRSTWRVKIDQEQSLIEEVNKTQSSLKQTAKNLVTELKTIGVESIEAAIKIRLKDNVYLAYDKQHSTLQQKIQIATTQLELQQKEILKLKESVSLDNKDQVRKDLNSKEEELEKLKSQEKEVAFYLRNQARLKNEIEVIEKKLAILSKEAKPWKMLNSLIGDATGNRFNDYAQDMTLTHLLHLANKRLDSLNKRYKMDKPKEGEGDGLMVIDQDMGNQRRAISTLSGGETFMASLALALALSDLAAKNVQIESMFIDEGFGTLDAESLDQTLDTLERLQIESSKIIGIISHVDSVKERIATQIQLTQDGKGYSKMEIVGG